MKLVTCQLKFGLGKVNTGQPFSADARTTPLQAAFSDPNRFLVRRSKIEDEDD